MGVCCYTKTFSQIHSLSPNSHFFLVDAVSIIVLRNKCQLFWEKQMVQLNFKGCIFYYLILVLFLTKLAFPMFFPSWSSASVCKIHIKSRKKIPYKSKILAFDCLKKNLIRVL